MYEINEKYLNANGEIVFVSQITGIVHDGDIIKLLHGNTVDCHSEIDKYYYHSKLPMLSLYNYYATDGKEGGKRWIIIEGELETDYLKYNDKLKSDSDFDEYVDKCQSVYDNKQSEISEGLKKDIKNREILIEEICRLFSYLQDEELKKWYIANFLSKLSLIELDNQLKYSKLMMNDSLNNIGKMEFEDMHIKDVSEEAVKQGLIAEISNLRPLLNAKHIYLKSDEELIKFSILDLKACLQRQKDNLKG